MKEKLLETLPIVGILLIFVGVMLGAVGLGIHLANQTYEVHVTQDKVCVTYDDVRDHWVSEGVLHLDRLRAGDIIISLKGGQTIEVKVGRDSDD